MVSKAQAAATQKYDRNTYDKVLIRIRKDTEPTRETITRAAESVGLSMQKYVMEAVKEKLIKDGVLSDDKS